MLRTKTMVSTAVSAAQIASKLTQERKSALVLYCSLTDTSLKDIILEALADYIDCVIPARISQIEKNISGMA